MQIISQYKMPIKCGASCSRGKLEDPPSTKMICLEELESTVTNLIKKSLEEAGLRTKECTITNNSEQETGGENRSLQKGTWPVLSLMTKISEMINTWLSVTKRCKQVMWDSERCMMWDTYLGHSLIVML